MTLLIRDQNNFSFVLVVLWWANTKGYIVLIVLSYKLGITIDGGASDFKYISISLKMKAVGVEAAAVEQIKKLIQKKATELKLSVSITN